MADEECRADGDEDDGEVDLAARVGRLRARAGQAGSPDAAKRRKKALLGVSAACRESFRVFTLRSCFITQPAGHATYCGGKARNSWIIF